MNNRGFTLIELLVVIVLLALIMSFALPNISKLTENNNKTKYATMEKILLEYQKVYFEDTKLDYVGLHELCFIDGVDDNEEDYTYETGLTTIDRSCKGYVDVKNRKAYIKCPNYETQGIDEDKANYCIED